MAWQGAILSGKLAQCATAYLKNRERLPPEVNHELVHKAPWGTVPPEPIYFNERFFFKSIRLVAMGQRSGKKELFSIHLKAF
jgi:hypothetical protein